MKVIKIVGKGAKRRTYVSDGPGCPSCNGTGWFDYNAAVPKMPCLDCHGTGFKAVEDWTDAVKAEWLSNNISDHLSWAIENGYYVYTICQGEFTGERETELAENDDFSAALTAAVIAVAEGDK